MKIFRKYSFVIVGILIISFSYSASYSQENQEKAKDILDLSDETKNELRLLHNQTVSSCENIQNKIKSDSEKECIENIKKETKEYYDLAKKLEKRGEYLNALECYKKILDLTDDHKVKPFIAKKNKRLKTQAKKEKKRLLEKIRRKERELQTNEKLKQQLPKKAEKEANKKARLEKEKVEKKKEELMSLAKKTQRGSMLTAQLKDKAKHKKVESKLGPEEKAKKKELVSLAKKTQRGSMLTAKLTEEAKQMETESKPALEEDKKTGEKVKAKKIDTGKNIMTEEEKRQLKQSLIDAEYFIEEGDRLYENIKYKDSYEIYKKALEAIEKAAPKD